MILQTSFVVMCGFAGNVFVKIDPCSSSGTTTFSTESFFALLLLTFSTQLSLKFLSTWTADDNVVK